MTESKEPGPVTLGLDTVGIDPMWIAASSVVDGRTPVGAEFVGFVGTGQMSRNARFTLDWSGDEGPDSIIVKIPSTDPVTRAMSFEHGTYAKECEFYRSIAALVDVESPTALAVHFSRGALRRSGPGLRDRAGRPQRVRTRRPVH